MKTIIFGGAFDPPHLGHINLVKSLRQRLKSERFIIIPTGNAPHKSSETPFETRFKLAQAAFPDCEVSDIEGKESNERSQKSYTVNTIAKLKQLYPESSFVLAIGSDMLLSFTDWKDYEQILAECEVVALSRDSSLEKHREYSKAAERLGIKLIDIPVTEMSSRQIRALLSRKRYTHSINTAIICGELSKIAGFNHEMSEKAYIAGLFHDIAKELPDEKLQKLISDGDFQLYEKEVAIVKLWHSPAGAVYVRKEFGITDPEILSAIRFHTVGRDKAEDMSTLEKIVYVADKISYERDYEGLVQIRELAFSDIDSAYKETKKRIEKTIKEKGDKKHD
ncbi:MAG: nicotinate (nicotinamide) nucleotide adenylyltransferase [Oscillospiraceae bacterium]|nr:nicotinate (nicotinamide) nucleotide adenylyltransferase [Oscillospiraceae bacterium]